MKAYLFHGRPYNALKTNCMLRFSARLRTFCRKIDGVAEREGFEPSIRFTVYTLSRRAPSTTRPPLLVRRVYWRMKKNQSFTRVRCVGKSFKIVYT